MSNPSLSQDLALKRTVHAPVEQKPHYAWRDVLAGEAVEFTGCAVRADGTVRRVEGKATPADAAGGKIKVRVFVTQKIELIFNTTFRFAPK